MRLPRCLQFNRRRLLVHHHDSQRLPRDTANQTVPLTAETLRDSASRLTVNAARSQQRFATSGKVSLAIYIYIPYSFGMIPLTSGLSSRKPHFEPARLSCRFSVHQVW